MRTAVAPCLLAFSLLVPLGAAWSQPDDAEDLGADTYGLPAGGSAPAWLDLRELSMSVATNGSLLAWLNVTDMEGISGEAVYTVFFEVAGEAYFLSYYTLATPANTTEGDFNWGEEAGTAVGAGAFTADGVQWVVAAEDAGLAEGATLTAIRAGSSTGAPVPTQGVFFVSGYNDTDMLVPTEEPLDFTYALPDGSPTPTPTATPTATPTTPTTTPTRPTTTPTVTTVTVPATSVTDPTPPTGPDDDGSEGSPGAGLALTALALAGAAAFIARRRAP